MFCWYINEVLLFFHCPQGDPSGDPSGDPKASSDGVRYDPDRRAWLAVVKHKTNTHYLGRYSDRADAIRARAAVCAFVAENNPSRSQLRKFIDESIKRPKPVRHSRQAAIGATNVGARSEAGADKVFVIKSADGGREFRRVIAELEAGPPYTVLRVMQYRRDGFSVLYVKLGPYKQPEESLRAL